MADYVVAKLAEIPKGMMKAVQAGGKNLVIFHDVNGAVSALEDRCSHANIKLSRGQFSGTTVTCPAHGAMFDVCTGNHLCMPAVTPVRRYAAKVVGEEIVVSVG